MTLTEEFLAYPADRAAAWMQKKKIPWTLYGQARSCKAVIDGNTWAPAEYTPDGKTPSQNGVDVVLFPLIQGDEVVNIVAFEPKVPLQLYLRQADSNLWDLLDLLAVLQE